MNKDRRERLLDVASVIEDAKNQIQDIIEEETEAIDNMPESLQCTDRIMRMNDGIVEMERLIAYLDTFNENLNKTVENLKPTKMAKYQINPGWEDESHLQLIETAATELANMGVITEETLHDVKDAVQESRLGK